jgi:Ca-activated chloride channel family protein
VPPATSLPGLPGLSGLPALPPLTFAEPALLWTLLLLPLALLLYLLVQRRRGRVAERFTSLALLPNLAPRSPGWRRHAPAVLYLVALGALLVSLARPQAVIPVRKDESTVVMVMDTSISMVATDVQPNRLSAAQSAGRRFLETLPEAVRVGLVSFSNAPEVQTLPTDDRQALRTALQGLQAGGGTAMGDALSQALDIAAAARAESAAAAGATPAPAPPTATPARPAAPATPGAPGANTQGAPAAVLLLSDGAQTAGTIEPLAAAQRARELGIPIYTIALGTQGGTIESPDAPGTGQRMAVPPDEATLRQVAEATGGRYYTAPTADDLRAVYEGLAASVNVVPELREVTAPVAGTGAALLIAGGALALAWFNRFP